MKIKDAEAYRKDGHINIDEYIKDFPTDKVTKENRGSNEREKDWLIHGSTSSLARSEMLVDENNNPNTYSRYAELIVEEMAKQVGIEAAHYDLIKYKESYGVISENVVDCDGGESLILAYDLINSLKGKNGRKTNVTKAVPTSIDDIFSAYKYAIDNSEIDSEQFKRLNLSTAKIALFDTFTMNTDRHTENLAVIYKEGEMRISPIFDNECSLMLDTPIELIDELLDNKNMLDSYVDNQLQMITVPDEEKDIDNKDWQDLLYYLCDNSKACMDFAQKCCDNLDIEKAIQKVEERISFELPETLKKFVELAFKLRTQKIERTLGIEKKER